MIAGIPDAFRSLLFSLLALAAVRADASTLTLPTAIAEAMHAQPQIEQSAHNASASRDLSRAAHAQLLPQVSLATGSIWSESRAGQPLFVSANGPREVIAQVRVSFPLYDAELRALAKVARDQSAVARLQLQATRWMVVARVVNDYYRVATLMTQERIWKSTLSTDEKLYRDTYKAYRAGAVSRLDLVQTELLRNQASTGLQQSAAEAKAAMQVMNLQMGRPRRSTWVLAPLPCSIPVLPSFSVLAAQAEATQPLLQVAKQQIDVAQAQVAVRRGAIQPKIRAYGAYGVDTATAPRGKDLGWQGSISLSMPIFGFGAQRQQIAAAQEQLAALRSARRALILQIRSQLAQNYGAAVAAQKTLVNARRAEREAERVYAMTRKGYFAGALNALDLAQAEGAWVRARLDLSTAAVAVQLTRAQLELDTGRYPNSHTGIRTPSCS